MDIFNNTNLIERFTHIAEWASKITSVRIQNGERKDEIYNIQNQVERLIEPLLKNEMTQFMIAPILEHYFNMIRPAINIPVDELLSNDTTKLDECRALVEELANHPVRNMWSEKAEVFRQIAEQAGYTFDRSDYKDLAIIAPIVADAMTTLDTYVKHRVFKARSGNCSGANPVLIDEIRIFSNVEEAVELYETVPAPAFIGFFGVQQTYGQNNNDFAEWRYGSNARKNNLLRNDHMTEEEYQNTIDRHSRRLFCMVKDGENFWVFNPPAHLGQYDTIGEKFTNEYGQRKTYAPIQIFFSGTKESNTTALVPYTSPRWSLREILDEEQKIWLPIFFSTIKGKFFGDVEIESRRAYLHNETHVVLQLPGIEVNSNLPAVVKDRIDIPSRDDLFGREELVDEDGKGAAFIHERDYNCYAGAIPMMDWMGITSEDIKDAPISPKEFMGRDEAIKKIEEHTVAAYYKVIRERLPEFWAPHATEAHKWLSDYISSHRDEIFEDIQNGVLNAEIHVHKKPLYNEDGTPKMYRPRSWEKTEAQMTDETDIDIGKSLYGRIPFRNPYKWWSSPAIVDKRPACTVSLYPRTPEDIAKICHCKVEELPKALQYMNYAKAFDDRQATICTHIHFIFNKTDFKKVFPEYR